MAAQLSAGTIIGRSFELIERNPGTAIVAAGVFAALQVAQDVVPDLRYLFVLLGLPVTLVLQYLVTQAALASAGLPVASRPGLSTSFCGTALGVSILSGLATLLLIVPGVYLYLRWSTAVPSVLAEGLTTDPAMSGSMTRTEGHLVPIGGAQLVLNLPWIAGFALGIAMSMGEDPANLMLSLLASVLVSLGFVASWFCMVATYLLLRPEDGLEEVFA